MKKIAALALSCSLLVLSLTGCSDVNSTQTQVQDEANFLPDVTANPVSVTATPEPLFAIPTDAPLASIADSTATPNPDMMAALEDATAEPTADITAEPEVKATFTPEPTVVSPYSGYSYAALTDASFGFTLDYPANWRNMPGKYTACYKEQVAEGDFPARVAVTSKKMPHKPESETVVKQFQSYAQNIYKQYDPETFEFSDLTERTFMGKKGYEITYLAYSGDIEVKGYMCCSATEYTIYVYHFCSAYDDYGDMTPVMVRIRDSVKTAE